MKGCPTNSFASASFDAKRREKWRNDAYGSWSCPNRVSTREREREREREKAPPVTGALDKEVDARKNDGKKVVTDICGRCSM